MARTEKVIMTNMCMRIIYRCCDTRSVGRNWIENFRTKTLWDKRLDEG